MYINWSPGLQSKLRFHCCTLDHGTKERSLMSSCPQLLQYFLPLFATGDLPHKLCHTANHLCRSKWVVLVIGKLSIDWQTSFSPPCFVCHIDNTPDASVFSSLVCVQCMCAGETRTLLLFLAILKKGQKMNLRLSMSNSSSLIHCWLRGGRDSVSLVTSNALGIFPDESNWGEANASLCSWVISQVPQGSHFFPVDWVQATENRDSWSNPIQWHLS